jgi:hypothetical protein
MALGDWINQNRQDTPQTMVEARSSRRRIEMRSDSVTQASSRGRGRDRERGP